MHITYVHFWDILSGNDIFVFSSVSSNAKLTRSWVYSYILTNLYTYTRMYILDVYSQPKLTRLTCLHTLNNLKFLLLHFWYHTFMPPRCNRVVGEIWQCFQGSSEQCENVFAQELWVWFCIHWVVNKMGLELIKWIIHKKVLPFLLLLSSYEFHIYLSRHAVELNRFRLCLPELFFKLFL